MSLIVSYVCSEVPRRARSDATVYGIRGPLRLAKKYQMDRLFQYLVDILDDDWPNTFSEWERNQQNDDMRKAIIDKRRDVLYPGANIYDVCPHNPGEFSVSITNIRV